MLSYKIPGQSLHKKKKKPTKQSGKMVNGRPGSLPKQGCKLFESMCNIAVSKTNKKPMTHKNPHTPVFQTDS